MLHMMVVMLENIVVHRHGVTTIILRWCTAVLQSTGHCQVLARASGACGSVNPTRVSHSMGWLQLFGAASALCDDVSAQRCVHSNQLLAHMHMCTAASASHDVQA
jgi:hypothetical protein